MPVVIPDDHGILRFHWLASGDFEEMIFTLGVEREGSATAGAIALAGRTAWVGANAMSTIFSEYTFVRTTCTLRVGGDLTVGESLQNSVGTASSGNPLPSNCAFLVKKETGFSSRKLRGRFFMPPFNIGEGDVDHNGVIAGASVTAVQTRLTAFLTALLADSSVERAVVLHGDATDPTTVAGLVLQPKIATQRNRMRK